jgi:hypothetical protein
MLDTRVTAVVVLPMVHVFSTQTVAEFYRHRSNPNLDKTGSRYTFPSRSNRPLVGGNQIGIFAEMEERKAQVVLRDGVSRVQFRGLVQDRDGLAALSFGV